MDERSSWIGGVMQQVVAGAILAIGAAIFGAVGFLLAKATVPLQEFGPLSYYLAGLVAALLGGLIILIAIAIWRKINPLPAAATAPTGDDTEIHRELAGLETRCTDAIDALKLQHRADRETDHANVTALANRVDTGAEGARDYTKGIHDALLVQIATEAGERAGLAKKIERLGELNNENLEYTRRQIASLYDALNAIFQRERLKELSRLIEAGAAELRGPTEREEDLNDIWDEWETKQRAWRNVLEEWCGLANCYSDGLSAKILTVSEDELHQEGKAGLSQFPSIGALMIYRGFNIRYFKWRNWREEGESAVRKIAIQGTAQSRPIYLEGNYAGDRDEHSKGSILRRIVEGSG